MGDAYTGAALLAFGSTFVGLGEIMCLVGCLNSGSRTLPVVTKSEPKASEAGGLEASNSSTVVDKKGTPLKNADKFRRRVKPTSQRG